MILLDTPVVFWLYTEETDGLPAKARYLLDTEELRAAPVIAPELQAMCEVNDLGEDARAVLAELGRTHELEPVSVPANDITDAARGLAWATDPIDRMNAAYAVALGARLLTPDETLLANLDLAVWD